MLADVALLLLDLAVKIIDFVRDALFVSFIGSTSEISPGILQALLQRVQPLYRRSLDIREKVLGPEHPEVAVIRSSALAFARLRRPEKVS